MSTRRCCAVIVNYRTSEQISRCVRLLSAEAPELTVVVVNNDSSEESLVTLGEAADRNPRIVVSTSDENRGFAAGCNRGIDLVLERWPDTDHLLLLNPDTIPQPGFLDSMLRTAVTAPRPGVVGGRVLDEHGRRTLYENGRIRWWTLGRSLVPAPPGRDDFETEFIVGALMLIDVRLLKEGLRFDERYFLYVEDLDFCMQVVSRRRSLRVSRAAAIFHREGSSQSGDRVILPGMRDRQLYYLTRNKVLFARKWLRSHQRICFYLTAILAKPLIAAIRFRRLGFLAPYYKGLRDGFSGRYGRAR